PKISYRSFVIIFCLVSFTVANFGLTNIIKFAIPVLMLLYPLAIVLILLAIFSSLLKNKRSVYTAAMLFTFAISFFDGYNALVDSLPGASFAIFDSILAFYSEYLPLYDIGLGWILPALAGIVIGLIMKSEKVPS